MSFWLSFFLHSSAGKKKWLLNISPLGRRSWTPGPFIRHWKTKLSNHLGRTLDGLWSQFNRLVLNDKWGRVQQIHHIWQFNIYFRLLNSVVILAAVLDMCYSSLVREYHTLSYVCYWRCKHIVKLSVSHSVCLLYLKSKTDSSQQKRSVDNTTNQQNSIWYLLTYLPANRLTYSI